MNDTKNMENFEENNIDLVSAFGKTMYEGFLDANANIEEYGFNELVEHIFQQDLSPYLQVVQKLPIIKYFVTAGKFIATIRERNFLQKTQKFLATLKNGQVKIEEIEKRKIAIKNKEKWVYKELELLVLTIDRFDRTEKAKILAEIYKAYLNGEITILEFDDFCSITERLFLSDIIQIRVDYEEEQQKKEIEDKMKKQHDIYTGYVTFHTRYLEITGRLLAIGLMCISAQVSENTRVDTNILEYVVSEKGKKYAKILSRIDFLGIGKE